MSAVPSPEKLFKERHQSKKNCSFVSQHHGWSFLQHFLHSLPKKRVDKVTSQAKVLKGHIVISLATEGKGLSIIQPPWGSTVCEVRDWPKMGQFEQGLLLQCLTPSTSALHWKSLYNTAASHDTASQANGWWMWYSERSGSTGEVLEQEQFTQSWTNAGYKADFPCLLLRTLDRKLPQQLPD